MPFLQCFVGQGHVSEVRVAPRPNLLVLCFVASLGRFSPLLSFGASRQLGLSRCFQRDGSRACGRDRLPGAHHDSQHQRRHYHRPGAEGQLVAPNQFLEPINIARRTGPDRLLVQMPLEVPGQTVHGLIAARPVLLQAFHDNPVQVPPHRADQFGRLGMMAFGSDGQFPFHHRAQFGRGPLGLLLLDRPAHGIQTRFQQFFAVEGGLACQQLIQQHA